MIRFRPLRWFRLQSVRDERQRRNLERLVRRLRESPPRFYFVLRDGKCVPLSERLGA